MKRLLLSLMIMLIAGMCYAESSIDEVFVLVFKNNNRLTVLGNEPEFYAEIEGSLSNYRTQIGAVETLVQRVGFSAIDTGTYKISLEPLFDDFYQIIGTDYVLQIKYGYITAYKDYILEISSYSGTLSEIDPY